MNTQMISQLRRELQALESELSADPRYIKVQRIKALLAAYQDVPDAGTPIQPAKPTPLASSALPARDPRQYSVRHARPATKVAMMEDETDRLIREHGGTVHRQLILQTLIDKGVLVGIKSPIRTLASFLSTRNDKYVSDGRGNFRFRDPALPLSGGETNRASH